MVKGVEIAIAKFITVPPPAYYYYYYYYYCYHY